ncbi:transposase [Terasakiella sp.]|uniref:transposase n=1 Tax=Terasakiella sp. TaxID=2034861 RepID=UPI003AA899C1
MKRTITPTFREEAAQVALSSTQPRKIIAADFGIGVSTLNRWISEYRNKQIPEPSDDVQKELARLRREVRDLREERDILKKAARYFASQKP